ncbi:bifunctional tRNA (5-methylaminomethyl-2-thiouridine)(34)-methyltransferase MnmD/FAD-dependent 5-carboxymethylaminomethyl-2-thiouridine(34) oxidoreductase MnmC [Pseudomaricurvus sp.]|uniref:bifunctional tRNA (5-methylaminomethyl-2-thiouridine)(34)-methyltransferase MnmD/FAD-dependent 5-carboxymethylaminomethyl-2-thiouridine(34) oxidoreductase MnmC n=1 Tax=Pseudomaricurvus sp. TaxID=2004510 RepID=UPI003F6C32CC
MSDSSDKPTSSVHSASFKHATLRWDADGLPLSDECDDYYFSKLDGLAETRYLYLEHNFLESRWQALTPDSDFVIGETGFGTGLSFLSSWQLWQQSAPQDANLHYLSVEKAPLRPEDLERSLALWPELKTLADQLIQQYPPVLHPGFHHLVFAEGRVRLTLIIGEACEGLEQLLQSTHPAHRRPQRGIDAWFLDGFSPAKNPDMWRSELFERVQQLSAPEATVATFAAATMIKRGLTQHGFQIHTGKGFGRKREMVYGKLIESAAIESPDSLPCNGFNSPYPVPWQVCNSQTSQTSKRQISKQQAPKPQDQHALIIGGGIAGCHTARALANRGWRVTLLERHEQLAQEGSGNPQGVLYAKLSHRQETLSDFNLQALQFAQRSYRSYWDEVFQKGVSSAGERCGVLQLASQEKSAHLHDQLSQSHGEQGLFSQLDAQQASAISGIDSPFGGLFFPQAGWINPARLCQWLTQHPNIDVVLNSSVDSVRYNETAQQWQVHTECAEYNAPTLVITTASHALNLVMEKSDALGKSNTLQELPLKPIRGQVSYVKATEESQALKTVLCGEGYLPPATEGQHCLGATFNPKMFDLSPNDDDHRRNLATMSTQAPALADTFVEEGVLGGRAALRCTTPDYLPMVGALPKYAELMEDFALLRKNARSNIPHAGRYWPGLFINVGHGSRGLTYTPLCAEILAAQIHGEPTPVGQPLQTALHPGRFWIRDLIRKKR